MTLPLLAFLALLSWGFASPVGSSPDDDFHLPSVWCGLGEREGLCEPASDLLAREVPAAVAGEPCYARDGARDASCWTSSAELVETERVNTQNLYPPLFYAVMSVFASSDVETSVLLMRGFNAVLFVGLVTATAALVPASLRRTLVLPFAVTIVPLGAFVVPSTNPSSWAYLSAGVTWLALYASTVVAERRRQLALAGMSVLGAVLGAGARGDAGIYACLAVFVVAIMSLRRDRKLMIPALAGVSVVVVGAGAYLSSSQGGQLSGGFSDGPGGPPLGLWDSVQTVLSVPDLWIGAIGGWGLGWFDVPLPRVVPVLGWAVLAAVCFLGLGRATGRSLLAAGVVLAASWGVPALMHQQTGVLVGAYVQPRYILPLLVILVGVLVVTTPRGPVRWTRAQGMTAAFAVGLGAAVSLHTTIRRFTVGIDTPVWNLDGDPRWWWGVLAPTPVTVLVVGSLASVSALVLADRLARRAEPLPDDLPLPQPHVPER
ncbi:DUF2142 domain-containing protein [Cellulosimicrobium cellulans]|uniref:DUF2142 domain-containing protein n=1 Tax=Cellulosimicrobium cellulans TaxID=1710 RepID=UPI0008491B8B|nr:DUF2142 domain-containing protein [Cellulosimicrobium cellulans]